ncbi:MAG: GAF and ANTAR domain-containing protein [Candidatus Omnitrophica bacterium]|nr:GAF and ANTAR domain-containing protein [Candidatus Omnitrophota bacterium]
MPARRKNSDKKYLETMIKISKAITSDLYLEDILKLVVKLTASVMGAKICALWLLNDDSKELKIGATQAMSPEYLKERVIKIGEGIVGLVAKNREPIVIKDVATDERYKEKTLAKKEGLVSMLSVPMLVKDKIIGVINIYTVEPQDFTKSDIDLLSAAANQSAVAIENTELMVKTKVIQEELETRKKVEKAKGVLMKEQGFSEDEAFNTIRKASMNRRVSMKAIAEAIILSFEISKGSKK